MSGSNGSSGGLAFDEHAVHVAGRHAIGQPGGDERAGTHADIGVASGQIDADQHLIQRRQRAKFINSAQRTASRKGETDFTRVHDAASRMF